MDFLIDIKKLNQIQLEELIEILYHEEDVIPGYYNHNVSLL